MGDWYSVGVFAGLGVAIGIAVAGLFGDRRAAVIGPVVAGVLGAVLGLVLADAEEAIAGAVGGLLGGVGSIGLVRGALARGGTSTATAAFVLLGAVVVAALAFVPILGYVEALALPVLGLRLRKRSGKRYAGLRTLARD
jgi:hypothetical protein